MTNAEVERLVVAGLDQGGRLIYDPGAATGEFTKRLGFEMRRCFQKSNSPGDYMATLLVPWGTRYSTTGTKRLLKTSA